MFITCPRCGLQHEINKDIQPISNDLKAHNAMLFEYARSNSPELKIPYTLELVNNLKISVKSAGTDEYDAMLNKCEYWANRALVILNDVMNDDNPEKDWGRAVIACNAVIQEVGVMIYDPQKRWASTQSGAFRYPTSAAKQEVK